MAVLAPEEEDEFGQQQQQQQQQQQPQDFRTAMSLCSSSSSSSSSATVPSGPPSGDPMQQQQQPSLPPPQWHPQPPPPPLPVEAASSPPEEPPLCAGCRLRICDQYYLSAVGGRRWHARCLRCAECGVQLDALGGDPSAAGGGSGGSAGGSSGGGFCYERNGFILCREDYLKTHPPRHCSRCLREIAASDLVMRARHCLFHLDCFRCLDCDAPLRKGDLFGMAADAVYCRTHFEMQQAAAAAAAAANECEEGLGIDHQEQQQALNGGLGFLPPPPPPTGSPFPSGFPPGPPPPPLPGAPSQDGWFPPGGEFGVGPEAGDFPYNNNNEPTLSKRRGRKKRKVPETFGPMKGFMEGAFPPGAGLDGSQAKTKRARTSFKHHQLRIMKAHFQINQNPDSRELKMLSQKTGLDKKVLQVWFQNARAKWRRVNAQSGSTNATATSRNSSSSNMQQQQQPMHHQMLPGPSSLGLGGHDDMLEGTDQI